MALRRTLAAAATVWSNPRASRAVFARGLAGSVEKFKEGPPVQSKRPAYVDGVDTPHTAKWMEDETKRPPSEMIAEVPPIPIHADRVSCATKGACHDLYGERMGLGAPNTYYQLNSTTPENPVKCKYCGLRFYGVH